MMGLPTSSSEDANKRKQGRHQYRVGWDLNREGSQVPAFSLGYVFFFHARCWNALGCKKACFSFLRLLGNLSQPVQAVYIYDAPGAHD